VSLAQAKDRDAIERKFLFEDFTAAWEFMEKTASVADVVSSLLCFSQDFPQALSLPFPPAPLQMNHHPEWFNVYNRVEVTLTTHDCQGLSKYVRIPPCF
jgi:4a-hydroxytetrahydrobiopterin dehydratase